MYEHFTESEKQKLQSTRTNFLSQLLKRQNSTPQSTRYEETAQSTEPSLPTMSSNKGFRFLTTKFGEGDGSDSEPEPNSGLVISFYDPEIKAEDAHGRTLNDILEWSDAKLERCHNYIQMLFPLPEGSPFNWEAPVIDREVMEAFLEREELRANLRRSFERMLNFYGFVGVGVSKEDEETGEQEAQDKGEGEDRSEPTGKGKEKVAESEPAQKQDEETKQKPKEPAQEKSKPMPTARNVATTQRTETKVVDGDSNSHQGAQEAEPNSTTATKSSTSANTGNRTKTESSPKGYHIDLAPHWQQAFRNWAVRFDHNHLRITRILRCLRVLGLQEECEAYYSMLKYVFDHPSIRINERSMTYWQRAVRMPLHVAPDGERIMWLKKWEIEKEEAQRKQMDDVKD